MVLRFQGWWGKLIRALRWLVPGLGVKRWLAITLAGVTLFAVGIAILVLEIYRTAPDTWWLPMLSAAALQAIDRPVRALIFGGLGLGLILTGIWGINRSLMQPYLRPGDALIDQLRRYRRRERGPRIVTIGGGHGLSNLLRGLKRHTSNLTAIVTVADDGGSSGQLRREMGILPPGDIRNCLSALSSDEALLSQLFQYRFPNGDLSGHSFGNLFISALAEITGSFEEAVAESGRVLAIHGQVLPATLNDVRLMADVRIPNLVADVRIEGESQIPEAAGTVRHVWLDPSTPPAFPDAIRAILAADLIVVGPGSLYTSLLPNLLVPDLVAAIRASRALKAFVCNVATQVGETDRYTCGDHLRALEAHGAGGLFDVIVSNRRFVGTLPPQIDWVFTETDLKEDYTIHQVDMVDEDYPWRHDPMKLSQALVDLLQERAASLVE